MGTREEAKALRAKGYTYDQIAKELYVTRQAAWCAVHSESGDWFQHVTPERCIYKGLRDWMNENRCTASQLRRLVGVSQKSHTTIVDALKGKAVMKKNLIDAILGITGLTYEQAFGGGDE